MSAVWLDRDPLHDIPCHSSLPPIVEPRRAWVSVAGDIFLNVFERHALGKQIGNRCYSKGVRG